MLTIEAPSITEAHGGLLAVADVDRNPNPHVFIEGVSYDALQNVKTRTYEEGVEKTFDEDGVLVESERFTIYTGIESPLFVDTATIADAAAVFGNGEGYAVEQAVQKLLLNPKAVDITPVPGTPVTNIRAAVGLLEQAAGVNILGEPLLHANRYATSVMRDLKVNESDWTLRTKQGTPVANGAGYGAEGPGGAAAEATEAWLYISGQVHLWVSPVEVHESRELATNRNHTLAEAQYVAALDTPVYAILIGI